jgi:norsolorinic acid ketoreductase
MSGLVYLITGANRGKSFRCGLAQASTNLVIGIGLGLVAHYLQLEHTTVIAAVRNPSNAAELSALKSGSGSKLIIVKIESSSTTDAAEAVKLLKSKYGISHIDVAIANAGIGKYWGPALTTPISEFEEHLKVNATGTLILFQAVHDLLSAAKHPKFISIGTPVGSIGEIENFPLQSTAYGSSKAALHFLTRKLHFEHPDFVIFPLTPGYVHNSTDVWLSMLTV